VKLYISNLSSVSSIHVRLTNITVDASSDLIRSKLDVLLSIVSGLPSMVFVGWVIEYVLFPARLTSYDRIDALRHIGGGLLFLLIVLILHRKAWLTLKVNVQS